ncbi:Type 1 glutamine amidotransferase-like domain-containing protein [Candidatus Jorgensenbacteria bacterium]|nr:Type 1 glutamine amidotransferase-like domain-containing protein [Candidatus Jorgensenbacteria bacterium]
MIRFILHGGYTIEKNEQNDAFYKELSKYVPDGGNILLVYFSRKDEEVNKFFEDDKNRILEQAKGKKLVLTPASEENFMEQVRHAHAVYFKGGSTEKLFAVLKRYPDFTKSIAGKVIAGDSAGAYVLAKYYYSVSSGKIGEGLGLLPVRVICHYESPRFKWKNDPVLLMKQYPDNLELIVFKDFEWRTFVQSK